MDNRARGQPRPRIGRWTPASHRSAGGSSCQLLIVAEHNEGEGCGYSYQRHSVRAEDPAAGQKEVLVYDVIGRGPEGGAAGPALVIGAEKPVASTSAETGQPCSSRAWWDQETLVLFEVRFLRR